MTSSDMTSADAPRFLGDEPSGMSTTFLDVLLIGAWVARDELLDLYPDPAVHDILDLRVPRDMVPLLVLLDDQVPPGRLPEHDVLQAEVQRLLGATGPGGLLDPGQVGTDVPWGLLVGRLLDRCPEQAHQVAVTWVRRLDALSRDDHASDAIVVAVAHYAVAAAEGALGRPHRARRWAEEAHLIVEHEEPAGLALMAYVRAVRLLGRGRGDGG